MSINSEPRAKRHSPVMVRRYQLALRRYLAQGPAASLEPAVKLGRQAVNMGLETLDLAKIHEQALPVQSSTDQDRIIKPARAFFAEAITPIEETHRLALEANAQVSQLKKELNQRTSDLTTSNRKLKNSASKRKIAEEALRQREARSSQLLEQSQLLQEQLRHLSRRILSAQEEERKRISRELHDVVAQMLTGINIRLEALKADAAVKTKGLSKSILHTQRLVEKSVDIVHQFARELRPAMLDDLGLIPALYSYMTKFTKTTGIRVSLTAFAGVEELSNVKRTALYRVAQEALANIARHAKANNGEVIIEKLEDNVQMQIKDNGKSFDVEHVLHARKIRRMGLGLLGMRERMEMLGGSFSVKSVPGQGTTIQVKIPFDNKANQ